MMMKKHMLIMLTLEFDTKNHCKQKRAEQPLPVKPFHKN